MDLQRILKEKIWLLILVAIALGLFVPASGRFLAPYLTVLLMILMFSSALELSKEKVFSYLLPFRKKAEVIAIIHLVSPLLLFFLRHTLSEELYVGLMLASVVSSGMSVVFLSHLYKGIPSEALIITTIANLFSPIIIPYLMLLLTETTISIHPELMTVTLFKIVVLPLLIASIIRESAYHLQVKKYADSASLIVLFFLILGLIAKVQITIVQNPLDTLILCIIIAGLILINFALGYSVGTTKEERITYAITASYKNFTLSTVLALTLFSPLVALPSVLYTIMNNVLLIPLQFFFERRKR